MPNHFNSLLQRLNDGEGYLLQSGREWCLYSKRNNYSRPLDRLEPEIVKSLRDRGHLVERTQGGLETLARKQVASGRLSDHRPKRPNEETARIPEVNSAESPLSWLRSRKNHSGRPLISAEQFMAGERLRSDFERSCMEGRVTASWDFSLIGVQKGGNAAPGPSDSALASRQNVHAALDSVGPELASILVQVCCLSAGIEQAERVLDLPQRSGKAVLGLALTSLARHYGFIPDASRARRQRPISHWAVDDYRPAIPEIEGT